MSLESNLDSHCPDCGTPYGKRRRCYRCNGGGSPKAGENRKCAGCGQEFYAPKWKLNDTARNQGSYCSRACKHQGLVEVPAATRTVVDGQLHCARCDTAKPIEEFGDDPRKRNGKKSYCRECNNLTAWEWRTRYPERYEALKKVPKTERQKRRRRDVELQQKYRITLIEFDELVARQGGTCAICGNLPSGNGKAGSTLHVDHAHSCCPGGSSCGACVRGLICGNCNTLIGLAQESPDRLRLAADYLDRHAAKVAV